MPIERIVIDNFKSFRHLDLPLNPHMNLVVGDNEVGKSTLLEAIHAVVTGQLHGRNLAYELTPYLFHQPSLRRARRHRRRGYPSKRIWAQTPRWRRCAVPTTRYAWIPPASGCWSSSTTTTARSSAPTCSSTRVRWIFRP